MISTCIQDYFSTSIGNRQTMFQLQIHINLHTQVCRIHIQPAYTSLQDSHTTYIHKFVGFTYNLHTQVCRIHIQPTYTSLQDSHTICIHKFVGFTCNLHTQMCMIHINLHTQVCRIRAQWVFWGPYSDSVFVCPVFVFVQLSLS